MQWIDFGFSISATGLVPPDASMQLSGFWKRDTLRELASEPFKVTGRVALDGYLMDFVWKFHRRSIP